MSGDNYEVVKSTIEKELAELRAKTMEKEDQLRELVKSRGHVNENFGHLLTNEEISRYSRQIIVPNFGVQGQMRLKSGSVLIVGCGGLGCPAAQYLAGCGIGCIGLVDYDEVELNNLHRQLLHDELNIGLEKVESVSRAIKRLNSRVIVKKHKVQLDSSNAMEIISGYDLVVDASDNVATRYLVNDACVLSGKALVSGSAVQMEGQLTVYNHSGGPCYRCLFPTPPPPNTVQNCSDTGVLGPVPGVIGTLEALQVIHILLETADVLSSKLLLFDGSDMTFRKVTLRGKQTDCQVCGDKPSIVKLIDYEQFCGAPASDKGSRVNLLGPSERISARELSKEMEGDSSKALIDVRTPSEFDICHIPGSRNVPMSLISKEAGREIVSGMISKQDVLEPNKKSIYVICRRGNDSQIAVRQLRKIFPDPSVDFKDLEGGLHAWAKVVDDSFPVY